MVVSEEQKREFVRRLLIARTRILCSNGFFGLLLMHMRFGLDEKVQTAATDGERILFAPAFLQKLDDKELDFVLMHEILHVALRHCMRDGERDPDAFNVACDIVVNSNLLKAAEMNLSAITIKGYGVSMHLAPNGKEGSEYTAEEVYEMLPIAHVQMRKGKGDGTATGAGCDGRNGEQGDGGGTGARKRKGKGRAQGSGDWDDHSEWKMQTSDDDSDDVWIKRVEDAVEAVRIRDESNAAGNIPDCVRRMLGTLREPQLDWRAILNDFVQEEISDYSFAPPDRRFAETSFFLPDFNDTDTVVRNVLFMVDTSASMSDREITAVYSEIKGAIDQFGGKLCGKLGFFDAGIVEPRDFSDVESLCVIRPVGGGGTDFDAVFAYVRRYMADEPPCSIIILTDGFAHIPPPSAAMDIPVLWLLTNEIVSPPWGKVARIHVT